MALRYLLLIAPIWNRNDLRVCRASPAYRPFNRTNLESKLVVNRRMTSEQSALLIAPIWNRNISILLLLSSGTVAFNRTNLESKPL